MEKVLLLRMRGVVMPRRNMVLLLWVSVVLLLRMVVGVMNTVHVVAAVTIGYHLAIAPSRPSSHDAWIRTLEGIGSRRGLRRRRRSRSAIRVMSLRGVLWRQVLLRRRWVSVSRRRSINGALVAVRISVMEMTRGGDGSSSNRCNISRIRSWLRRVKNRVCGGHGVLEVSRRGCASDCGQVVRSSRILLWWLLCFVWLLMLNSR